MSDGHQSMSWLFTSRVACANCRFSACRAAFKSAKRSAGGATAATSAGAASDDMASQQVRQGEGHPGQVPSGQKLAESFDSCFRVGRHACKEMTLTLAHTGNPKMGAGILHKTRLPQAGP